MLINFKKKYVVLRNPKCASTFIWRFVKMFDKDIVDNLSRNITIEGKIFNQPHYNLSMVKKYLESNGYNPHDFTYFCQIRNPYHKLVSAFYYSKPDINFCPWFRNEYINNNLLALTPENFKKWFWGKFSTEMKAINCDPSLNDWKNILVEMKNFCYDPTLNIEYIRTECKEDYNKFKKFFTFNKSFLDNKINIGTDIKNYSTYYDDKMKDIIYEKYKLEFEIGKYNKEIIK